MLTEIEQQSLDIDWFFIADNKIGFVASGGGKLPDSVTNLNKNFSEISSYFRSLPEKTEAIINKELKRIKTTTITDYYLEDFVYMAKRGLYSFDKTLLNNFSDTNYHIVARPIECLRVEELPIEITDLINKTTYDGNIEIENSISSVEIR